MLLELVISSKAEVAILMKYQLCPLAMGERLPILIFYSSCYSISFTRNSFISGDKKMTILQMS